MVPTPSRRPPAARHRAAEVCVFLRAVGGCAACPRVLASPCPLATGEGVALAPVGAGLDRAMRAFVRQPPR
eukprot:5986151-Lingulodinium_polyedra.AAC.1